MDPYSSEQIYEKLESIEALLASLVRSQKSNKAQLLEDEVRRRKRMTVNDVQTFLGGISRPWALSLMKHLGENLSFKFIIGDRQLKRPSLIIYDEARLIRERYEKIKAIVDKEGVVTLASLARQLGFNDLERDFIILKQLVNDFVDSQFNESGEYYMIDVNKLAKKTINSEN